MIGYTDRVEEGVWKWVSGEPSGFTFWASNKPNNSNNEDYAIMNWQHPNQPQPQPPGAWNDVPGVGGYAIFEYDGLAVSIDITPGSDPNCFNLNGHGVIPVAILGSADVDVVNIDRNSLLFAGMEVQVRSNKGPLCEIEYSNGDSILDLVCHFEDNPDNWTPGNSSASVEGILYDGTPFEGSDSICLVP